MPSSCTKCSGADAGDGWSSKPTLFHRQSMRPHAELLGQKTCGIASASVVWKWALKAQIMAQFMIDLGATNMQMRTAKLQRIVRSRMVSHWLPIDSEQGRHLHLRRHRCMCRPCHTGALGDERHKILECPVLADRTNSLC